jgi:PTH1 family peptidyl-tRNA hydrolase
MRWWRLRERPDVADQEQVNARRRPASFWRRRRAGSIASSGPTTGSNEAGLNAQDPKELSTSMRIVVGLGNPGREYAQTRHNVGFMVVDELARRHGASGWKKRFRSELAEIAISGEKVILVKPQTYMNLSGHATREAINWYHTPLDNVLVVSDDLDQPFGALRMRAQGSAGGHNGLASIIEQLGTNRLPRLKLGIGRGPSTSTAHVLSRFSQGQENELPELVARAADAVEVWATEGIVAAMNKANRRVESAEPDPSASSGPAA